MTLSPSENDLFRRFVRDPEPEFQGWVRRQPPSTLQIQNDTKGVLPYSRLSGAPANGSWTGLSFGSNWADVDASHLCQYRKDAYGVVYLRGQAQRIISPYSYATIIGTLPSGFRPAQVMNFPTLRFFTTDGGWYPAFMQITTAGVILGATAFLSGAGTADNDTGTVGSKWSLDNISFFSD